MVVGFDELSNMLPVASHVLVSLAHVVVIVDQSSANEGLTLFVSDVVGFTVLVSAILFIAMLAWNKSPQSILVSVSKILNYFLFFLLALC